MVIKETDSIDAKVEVLNGLLGENLSATQRKKIQSEISMLKKGFQGEKQAAYYIDQYFPNRFIAHDLRIEMDGFVAQIDHIAINKFGFVILFETKNFSSDVKIDDDGVFHYFDAKRKSYRPFPSPIEQSKRHEKVIEKVFDAIGFTPIAIEHIVVFDHKSKVIKPKVGYENVCYPDMIEKTFDKMVAKVDLVRDFGAFGRLVKKAVKKDSMKPDVALKRIVEHYHTPKLIDYRAKFSVVNPTKNAVKPSDNKVAEANMAYNTTQTNSTQDDSVANHVNKTINAEPNLKSEPKQQANYSMLTLAKAAKQLGVKTNVFEEELVSKGFLERNEINYLMLTNKGKEFGIRFRKGKGGIFYLIPADKINQI